MTRVKPYFTNQESWFNILRKNICIPMSQREYSWESKDVKKFIGDIINIFEEGKYVEKMGSIINFKYSDKHKNDINDIYDGQQRLLTTVLILIVLGWLHVKLKIKVEQLLTVDTELDDLTPQQIQIKEDYNAKKIPKIYCVSFSDMKSLVYIFNNDNFTWFNFIDNPESFEDCEDYEDCEEYICNVCKKTISSKSSFIKHITKSHNYQLKDYKPSNLCNALEEIYVYLRLKQYDEKTLSDLYKFILNDIDIQYFECENSDYVTRIFDWENNRGMTVDTLDIVKNTLLSNIPNENRKIVYDIWMELKGKENKIYKYFGTKLFDLAIQLYNNHIVRKPNHNKLFNSITNGNTYTEIKNFFKIVEKLFEIMDEICDDKFGRLVNNVSTNCLSWEAYIFCLLPIFYKTNSIDQKLIKLMVKWYFRNLQFKNRSFNNRGYSEEFIKITNLVLKNKKYDYYKEIKNCLVKNKNENIIDENYIRSMKTMEFKTKNATHLFLFLETCLNTDSHITPMDLTLEHIYPKNDKEKLSNQSLIDNIGNLTLLEGKNSNNGHKGNSSIGAKVYDKKKISYEGSCSKITREIPLKFNCFTEETIIERNTQIVKLLNHYTNY